MMDSTFDLWLIIAISFLATYVWRFLGIVIANHLHPDSALSRWFACVAYAVLAGIIARMIVVQEGALAEAPVIDKLLGIAIGLAIFFMAKRNTSAGTAAAFLAFMSISLWRFYGSA
jgi:branched-subunit amino acid transport protein